LVSRERNDPPPDPAQASSWSAGIVNHGSYDDLERCLAALACQRLAPQAVRVYDTGLDRERSEALQRARPRVGLEVGENLGFAGGANRVIDRLRAEGGAGDFVLLLNPDVVLDADFGACLVEAMSARSGVAIATGKLLRPGRSRIDSAGIRFPRHRRPRDRGSEELDVGRFDRAELVEGASGAAMMLRVASLADLEIEGELFDEDFFLYHEDTDLCWRARNLGWQILYEPDAIAVHGRGWRKDERAAVPISVRRHSFKNHYLQVVKNEISAGLLLHLPWLVVWEVLRLGFVLLRDRPLLGAYRDAWRALPDALRKRRALRLRMRGGAPLPRTR